MHSATMSTTAPSDVDRTMIPPEEEEGPTLRVALRKLLEGGREVAVTTRIRSGGGQATVDLQRVEISGIAIEGPTLDFIIDNYLKPNYPDAKIGQPFALHKHVDRIEVARGVAYIITR